MGAGPIPQGGTGNISLSTSGTTSPDSAFTGSNINSNGPYGVNSPGLSSPVTTTPTQVSGNAPSVVAVSINDTSPIAYELYNVDSFWDQNEHTLQLPVCSSNSSCCVYATVANPTMKKRVQFTIVAANGWPELPPSTGNSNETILSQKILGKSVDLAGDHLTLIYRISGEYIFGVNCPDDEQLQLNTPPYVKASAADTIIPD